MIGSPLVIAQQARARMQAMLASMKEGASPAPLPAARPMPAEADVIITACEVSPAHGTGTLLLRMFPDSREIVALRTSNFYDGHQDFGAVQLCLPLAQSSRPEISAWLKWHFTNTRVRRILALPYLPADPVVAIALRALTGAPLCTFVMDDKNVCAAGIDDGTMQEMLAGSDVRLVISPEMQRAYERKYGMKFWVMPPLVPESMLRHEPVPAPPPALPLRGVLLGNIWGQRWLDMLRDLFRGSGIVVDWFCNQKVPAGLDFDRESLARDGIVFHEPVAEQALPALLARYPFAVVPTDTLDGKSPAAVRAIAELSLPSRIPTMVTTSHLPVLVIGSPKTSAAGFVTRFELGLVVPYERDAVKAAADHLMQPATQTAIRARAARLAGRFSAEGSDAWIWRSLAEKRAADMRYETLMPAERDAGQPGRAHAAG